MLLVGTCSNVLSDSYAQLHHQFTDLSTEFIKKKKKKKKNLKNMKKN